jgi:hypothetical protein
MVQATGKATRAGVVSDIKESPIKVQLSGNTSDAPLKLTPQYIGVLTNQNLEGHKNQGSFLLLTHKVVTPIRLLTTCDNDIDTTAAVVMGTGTMLTGGWGGRVTRSNKQFGIGIDSPAMSPTNPLQVTVFADQNPGRCSFVEQ